MYDLILYDVIRLRRFVFDVRIVEEALQDNTGKRRNYGNNCTIGLDFFFFVKSDMCVYVMGEIYIYI